MIARLKADFPVSFLCQKFGVSTSGFYEWSSGPVSASTIHHIELVDRVTEEFTRSHQMAGYRKVTAAIRRGGQRVNRKTVARIMQELGLASPIVTRSFSRAKARAARVKDPEDVLNRDFRSLVPGRLMVGDITYVPTVQGWLYVATVIDLASRAVLGFAAGARMTTPLVIAALEMARSTGLVTRGAVFHTDHGTQYRSKAFANYCSAQGIHRSMGARMECWDNAVAESFFSKLKAERLDWNIFTTRDDAASEVTQYIHHYNNERLHQSLDYATPAEKLAQLTAA